MGSRSLRKLEQYALTVVGLLIFGCLFAITVAIAKAKEIRDLIREKLKR